MAAQRKSRNSLSFRLGILGFFLVSSLSAESPSAFIKEVEYRLGDSPVDPNGNFIWLQDKDPWIKQTLPGLPPASVQNFLWERVRIPAGDWKEPTLFIEIAFGNFEVYSQGQRIYSFGKFGDLSTQSIWHHLISLGNTDKDQYLYFRMEATSSELGVDRAVLVDSKSKIILKTIAREFDAISLGFLFLFFGLLALSLSLTSLREKSYSLFGLLLLSIGTYTVIGAQSLLLFIPKPEIMLWIWSIALYSIPVINFEYFRRLFDLKYSVPLRIGFFASGIFLLVAISSAIFGIITLIDLIPKFQIMMLASIFALLGTTTVAAIKGSSEGRIILVGYFLMALFIVADILQDFGVIPFFRTLNHWGVFAYVLSLAFILFKRYTMLHTQLAESSVELENKNLELSKMDRLKDEFLANVSHELRTPLHGIMGLADSLAEGLDDTRARHMRLIRDSGKRLSLIVNDILDYSRLKYETMRLHLRPVDMESSVDVAFTLLHNMIANRPVKFVNDIQNIPFAAADEDRVEQILINLIGNAMKFTREGTIRATAQRIGERLHIAITDSGTGIPADRLSNIFTPFQQGDSMGSGIYRGSGLGLSIAKSIVEMHGGTIHVTSTPGKGSSFSFDLPVWAGPVPEQKPKPDRLIRTEIPHRPITQTRFDGETVAPRILVVDDEPLNLQILVNYLSPENYVIITASSAQQAIAELDKRSFSLVLLDVMMPGMSGLELCKIIRQNQDIHKLPIIFLSARHQTEDIVAGFSSGANDYVAKPFERTELLARVRTLLALESASRNEKNMILLRKELDTAQKIQLSIVPDKFPSIPGLALEVRYIPMSPIGGDLFDFFQKDENSIGIFLSDVSGHGIPAAIISAMTKIAFSLQNNHMQTPNKVLSGINDILMGKAGSNFLTAAYLFLDTTHRVLRYARGGHPPMMILREDKIIEFNPKGRLLGLFKDWHGEMTEESLHEKDRLFLFTDGFHESRNEQGEMFGEERLRELVLRNRTLSLNEFCDALVLSFTQWTNHDGGPDDDFAFIALDVL